MQAPVEAQEQGAEEPGRSASVQPLALGLGIILMLVGSFRPDWLAEASGKANHGLAMLWFWAMAAGFVRGVGFIPRFWLWRWIFSGWAAFAALAAALAWRFADL